MRHSLSAMLFLITGASTVCAGLDLVPSLSQYEASGFKHQQLKFEHDGRTIEYELPTGWTFRADPKHLYLAPPQKKFVDAMIEAIPLSKPHPLDAKTTKALKDQVVTSVPPGSQFEQVDEELENSILLDGNPSFQVTVSYQLLGTKFSKTTIFVNLPDTQLIFKLSAPKDDFESLSRAFRSSMFSWHWTGVARINQSVAAVKPPGISP